MPSFTENIRSCAKINLHLKVCGQRYNLHTLKMSLVRINWFDELRIELAEHGTGQVITNFFPTYPEISPENNLIVKAIKLFPSFYAKSYDANVDINKNIPPCSGLGAGSSNAASIMLLLNRLWHDFSFHELISMGLMLGSDIPFFLKESASVVEGVGEILSDLPYSVYDYFIVLVVPSFRLSTKAVFKCYDQLESLKQPLEQGTVFYQRKHLFPLNNDLIAPACYLEPKISQLLEDIKNTHAVDTSMSGSGSACFGIYDTFEQSQSAVSELMKKYSLVRIVNILCP